MKSTRIAVALCVGICATTPLVGLAHLSREIRYLDFFTKAFKDTDLQFPILSSVMLPFGPLDWWSYTTPAALAVAVAASLRSPIPPMVLGLMLSSSVLQALVMVAVAKPYFLLNAAVGNFPTTPYPAGPLIANAALVGISVGLAACSLWKMMGADPSRANSPGGESTGRDGGDQRPN